MINAYEAQKLTSDAVMTIVSDIDAVVRKAAQLGKHECSHIVSADSDTVEQVMEHLRSAGYTVTEESKYGYDCEWKTEITVNWRSTPNKKKKA